ncbi:hypothetical protein AQUCO_00300876v1 [Aquilegia coerulea]|uniref:Peptidase A1 domain-containing protein n=1 Tax=Aquilegia coerulea TaxID=218851 RepID=A0A2G5F0V4_AQUCA|nr:hypothetical protein AQUCO_00300876v1 [Aquilegia coerulea]
MDSPESPLYPGNLTLEQRLERLHNQSIAYISHMASILETSLSRNKSKKIDPEWIRSPVASNRNYFMAVVSIGTFGPPQISYRSSYMLLDTGSDLLWTQCENCKHCFTQASPLYPYTHSKSFKYLPCNQHPMCYPGKCLHDKCTYKMTYVGSAEAEGYLAKERFTFNSDTAGTETVELVFGCGFNQKNFGFSKYNPNPITGILGLGNGPRSFVKQLGNRAQGLMSYCIPPWGGNQGSSTFLRFGQDAQFSRGQQIRTTPLIRGPLSETHYYVELLDISVAGRRLNYPPGSFGFKIDGKGGTILDTGAPLVTIRRDLYTTFKLAVADYFAPLGEPREAMYGFDICYSTDVLESTLPTITFHFRSANLEVKSEVFIKFRHCVCLGVGPHDFDTFAVLIGNIAQSNNRFVYNVNAYSLSFAKEECKPGS